MSLFWSVRWGVRGCVLAGGDSFVVCGSDRDRGDGVRDEGGWRSSLPTMRCCPMDLLIFPGARAGSSSGDRFSKIVRRDLAVLLYDLSRCDGGSSRTERCALWRGVYGRLWFCVTPEGAEMKICCAQKVSAA